jgi:hypothetical protein
MVADATELEGHRAAGARVRAAAVLERRAWRRLRPRKGLMSGRVTVSDRRSLVAGVETRDHDRDSIAAAAARRAIVLDHGDPRAGKAALMPSTGVWAGGRTSEEPWKPIPGEVTGDR